MLALGIGTAEDVHSTNVSEIGVESVDTELVYCSAVAEKTHFTRFSHNISPPFTDNAYFSH